MPKDKKLNLFMPSDQVAFGNEALRKIAEPDSKLNRRDAVQSVLSFLRAGKNENEGHLAALHGCRHTGKTTILHHILLDMDDAKREKTVFFSCDVDTDVSLLLADISHFSECGFK